MLRKLMALLVLVAPAAFMPAISGCGEKRDTVKQTETRYESDPKMTSPGEPVVEP